MTHLPLEDRVNVWGIRGPDYTPKGVCAHPFCKQSFGWTKLEKHHLWPRSFLRHQPQNWVKLPDGTETGNLVYLCREHHQQITENKARIEWSPSVEMHDPEYPLERFFWNDMKWSDAVDNEGEVWFPLDPQPPRAIDDWPEDRGPQSIESQLDEDDLAVMAIDAADELTEPHSHVPEGSECPTCLRRVPKKKKDTTPTTKVVSFRLPLDNASDFEEIIEAAAKHLGVYEDSFWKYGVILKSLVLALQAPGEAERKPGHEAG